jgi:Complex I intermediate-associated protein 30 (CIA30)
MVPPKVICAFLLFVYTSQAFFSGRQVFSGTKATFVVSASGSNLDSPKKVEKVKKPWEFFRFIRTANFYEAFKPKFMRSSTGESATVRPGDTIWTAAGKNSLAAAQWGPLDDVVMGGASKTDLAPGAPFDGVWSGFVTTANNGGFAGIRTKLFSPRKDASACKGFLLKVKGDGQRYKLIARDDEEWNGVAWSTSFDTTAGRAIEVRIPFDKLRPTRYSRTIPDGGKYNSRSVTGVQLTLSKFEYDGGPNPSFREGPFRFEVEQIGFY